MNIVTTPRLLKRSMILVTLLATGLILSACGGSDKKSSSLSSSSSSSSAHSLIPTPVTPTGSGTWPEIQVTADGNKTLNFRWNSAPAGTTFYRLWKNADVSNQTNAYELVEDNITNISSGWYYTSDAVSVHLTDWVNSRYKVQACVDATTCVYSTEIITNSAMLSAITYVKASNSGANDWFGWSVALSGDGQTLAVGAPAEDSDAQGVNPQSNASSQGQNSDSSPNSGAVYVFRKAGGVWQQEAYIKASNTEQYSENGYATLANDRFGYQIALSADGNTLAVSAIQEDSPSLGINCGQEDLSYTLSSAASSTIVKISYNMGAVYIFKRSGADWTQSTYVKPHNPTVNELFGSSLSLSGDGKVLAVGTYLESSYAAGVFDMRSQSSRSCINFSASSISSSSRTSSSVSSTSLMGGAESGAVYLYKETENGWIQEAFIKASDAGALDHFGNSISLSQDGTTLAVGAPGEDSKDSGPTNNTVTVKNSTLVLNNGGVYIFTNSNDSWAQQAKVKPYDNGVNQQFGFSVALSGDGNTLAVGAPGDWSKSSGIEAIPVGAIGALGANYNLEDENPSFATGAAYIFIKDAENWLATTYLKASNAHPGYQFGHSLSLAKDGRTLAVGSFAEGSRATGINGDQDDTEASNAGAAYIFKLSNLGWTQTSYVKAPDTEANDRFANALKLDDSGDTLAVGAHRESSNDKGINGDKANDPLTPATGAVYLF